MSSFAENTVMDVSVWKDGKFEDKKWGIKPKFRYSYGEGVVLFWNGII